MAPSTGLLSTSLWRAAQPLVLASQSRARRELLAGAGIAFDIEPADLDERAIEQSLGTHDGAAVAMALALAKAKFVSGRRPDRLVVGADQTLNFDAESLGKPAGREAARKQLLALRGATHHLHSAVVVVRDGEALFRHVDSARLTMRAFSESFLDAYLEAAGDAVTSSVGGYQLEGLGVQLFERIDGGHTTILGLPLLPLVAFLRQHGCLQE
jgi:septum formation protein